MAKVLSFLKRLRSARTAALACLALLALSGCDFTVQPLGGTDGRNIVFVAVGKSGAPNAGIVCTRNGCVVIDPGASPIMGDLLRSQAHAKSKIFWENYWAAKKDRPPTQSPPVMYVFNTTYRGNHSFGNQSFERMADIISTSKAKERLLADGPAMRSELRDNWKVPGMDSHATTPATLCLDEGSFTLDTPEAQLKFVAMGDCVGEGDAVVYLPAQKILFAGDLVLPGFVPYYKGRTLTLRPWIEALNKIEKWDLEIVVPGHGDVCKKEAIVTQRKFLQSLLAEVDKAIKAGQTIEQAAQSVKLPEYSSWQHYNEWLGENVKLVYRELKGGPDAKISEASPGAVKPAGVEQPDGFRAKY